MVLLPKMSLNTSKMGHDKANSMRYEIGENPRTNGKVLIDTDHWITQAESCEFEPRRPLQELIEPFATAVSLLVNRGFA